MLKYVSALSFVGIHDCFFRPCLGAEKRADMESAPAWGAKKRADMESAPTCVSTCTHFLYLFYPIGAWALRTILVMAMAVLNCLDSSRSPNRETSVPLRSMAR